MKEQNPSLYLGCHWKDYAGMQLRIYDEWGRKIAEQVINSALVQLNMKDASSQIYFYSIIDKGEMKTSGKTIVMH